MSVHPAMIHLPLSWSSLWDPSWPSDYHQPWSSPAFNYYFSSADCAVLPAMISSSAPLIFSFDYRFSSADCANHPSMFLSKSYPTFSILLSLPFNYYLFNASHLWSVKSLCDMNGIGIWGPRGIYKRSKWGPAALHHINAPFLVYKVSHISTCHDYS